MKTDIILCGVGGQGILSIATIKQSHLQRFDSPRWCRCDYLYGTDGSPALSAIPGKRRLDYHL